MSWSLRRAARAVSQRSRRSALPGYTRTVVTSAVRGATHRSKGVFLFARLRGRRAPARLLTLHHSGDVGRAHADGRRFQNLTNSTSTRHMGSQLM